MSGASVRWRSRTAGSLVVFGLLVACSGSTDATAPPPSPEASPTATVAPAPSETSPTSDPTPALPATEATVTIVAASDLPPSPDGPPPAVLVGTRDGMLAIWETDSGATRREIRIFDDPREFGDGDQPFATGAFLDDVVLTADQALIAICCEPAVGALRSYTIGGDAEAGDATIAYGDDPAASYDGRLAVAFATGDFIAIHPTVPTDLDARGRLIDLSQLVDEGAAFTTAAELAWAPDGRHLGVMVAIDERPAELWIVDADADAPLVARVSPPDGRAWTSPAFLRDGTVLLVEHPADDESASSTLTALDLSTRETSTVEVLDTRVARMRTDASHTYLLWTGADGSLRWRASAGGPDTTIVPSGVLDADWR